MIKDRFYTGLVDRKGQKIYTGDKCITVKGYELPCGKDCPYARGNVIKILTREELCFHESVVPPNSAGKQCFKAWSYYEKTNWLTEEQQAKWKDIDDRLKQTDRRPEGWEGYESKRRRKI